MIEKRYKLRFLPLLEDDFNEIVNPASADCIVVDVKKSFIFMICIWQQQVYKRRRRPIEFDMHDHK